MSVRVVVWKEVIDLLRDRRTIAAIVLFPLLGMPSLALVAGLLASAQVVSVYIVYEEEESKVFAENLGQAILEGLKSTGLSANVSVSRYYPRNFTGIDVLVVIPKGFYDNITSLNRTGYIEVRSVIGSVAADTARSVINGVLSSMAWNIAASRVERLADMAGVIVDPSAVLAPLKVRTSYYKPGGVPAGPREAEVAQTARLIEFGLFFVVNPAVVYITDSILGEKERRTIESLLMTPISRRRLLAGKLVASSIVGFIAAMADTVGLLVYFWLITPLGIEVTPALIVVHAATTALLVVMVASLVAPIVARSQSVRAGQTISLLVISLAGIVYFAALLVDLSKIPSPVAFLLYLIPFTHAALIIHNFILGKTVPMLLHGLVMALYTLVFLVMAARTFDSERLILYRE